MVILFEWDNYLKENSKFCIVFVAYI
jgi:hypothetical protein